MKKNEFTRVLLDFWTAAKELGSVLRHDVIACGSYVDSFVDHHFPTTFDILVIAGEVLEGICQDIMYGLEQLYKEYTRKTNDWVPESPWKSFWI